MTYIDYGLLGVLALSIAWGAWRGLVHEMISLGGWIIAFLAANLFAGPASEALTDSIPAEGRVMLAGGLSPETVRDAIERVRPWAVDASSSLELEPGVKDHARVRAYVEAVRCS